MNYKNRRPKSFKGHCAMCAEGRPRNRRALTRQELVAPVVDLSEALDEIAFADLCECCFDMSCPAIEMERDVDRFMGLVPDTCVRVEDVVSSPVRVSVLERAPVLA